MIKLQLVRCLAVFMSACYIFSPLSDQIGHIMHDLSHGLQAPDFVISHAAPDTDYAADTHHEHHHGIHEVQHEHTVIDFVQSFLEGTHQNEQFPEQGALAKIKIDKHFKSKVQFTLPLSLIQQEPRMAYADQKLREGYPRMLYFPPI